MSWRIVEGDCRERLAELPAKSVDAIVTDPPYELGFMGKSWDASGVAYDPATWAACLRVLKPGGHLVAFGGSRTYHRMACAVEEAGFEIRDQVQWVYGSGFPKSHDIGKAIDREAGERPIQTGAIKRASIQRNGSGDDWARGAFASHPEHTKWVPITAPATDAARQWDGWGTALKPAHEPAVLARKPLAGTVAANVQAHGTGALHIDAGRVGSEPTTVNNYAGRVAFGPSQVGRAYESRQSVGRWPANVAHDGSAEAVAGMGAQARYFYTAKASTAEREAGLPLSMPRKLGGALNSTVAGDTRGRPDVMRRNVHPTVKPIDLMRWLVRLVTPPGGTVLDPFTGSGSTGIAATREGFDFLGVELAPEYAALARERIANDAPLFNAEPADAPDEPTQAGLFG